MKVTANLYNDEYIRYLQRTAIREHRDLRGQTSKILEDAIKRLMADEAAKQPSAAAAVA